MSVLIMCQIFGVLVPSLYAVGGIQLEAPSHFSFQSRAQIRPYNTEISKHVKYGFGLQVASEIRAPERSNNLFLFYPA
jgi:hypothetical protein